MRVAVVGATGYTGLELMRILMRHGGAEVVAITSETYQGHLFSEVFPAFRNVFEGSLEHLDVADLKEKAELVFLCLPHGSSMDVVPSLLKTGLRVIDLSGDFRFEDHSVYQEWYGLEHKSPSLLKESVFGLPELFAGKIRDACLLANPGCYVTGVVLALAPLLESGWIQPSPIYADCKSGVTGGGRKTAQKFHFPECNESFSPYSIAKHRHQPEMEGALERFTGLRPQILFSPHLVPMNRGILSTVYTRVTGEKMYEGVLEKAIELFKHFYANAPFVRVLPPEELPSTHNVKGSNFCDIGMVWERRSGTLVVVSALDNLIKGASGQAVQNMNIMAGFPEIQGLLVPGDFV